MDKVEWLARAHYHLEGWGIWRRMNRGEFGHGFDRQSTFLECGGSKFFDHMVEAEDSKAAAICDGIIDNLKFIHKTAIESRYLEHGVVKHNRRDAQELLIEAQREFWEKAKRWLV